MKYISPSILLLLWFPTAALAVQPAKHYVSDNIIEPFNYEGIRLLPGKWQQQYEDVKEFYLSLDPNSILHPFRMRAHGRAPGKSLGGAYGGSALGFGQWLAGMSRIAKVTNDDALSVRTIYLMNEFGKTIEDDGFYGTRSRERAPGHYGYDKIVGGLVDVYEYLGEPKALEYLDKITTWAEKNLDRSNEYALPREWYTLAENLYRAYELTGEQRYYDFAKVWDYTHFWGALAEKRDVFGEVHRAESHKSYHAYSTINSLASAGQAYRSTGEQRYFDTIVNAYDWMKETQMFATGGYGPEESLIVPNGMPEVLMGIRRGEANVDVRFHFETSCGSWAGFKIGKYLMRFTGAAKYGDWMERLMYNGVGAMPPMNDYGMIMYGSCYNTWGARKFHSTVWFCCQGSFLQTVNDYHDLIYFKDSKNIYVNLFVPSEVDWDSPDGKITLRQETKFPESNRMTYTVKAAQSSRFGLKFRVPLWSKRGMTFDVNGEPVKVNAKPGEWAEIKREWKDKDIITAKVDLHIWAEPAPAALSPVAAMYGPIVMVMANARDEEELMPHEGGISFPGDWISYHKNISMDPGRQLHSNNQLRPFYEMQTGEFYRMYHERFGKKFIPWDQFEFEGDWESNSEGRVSGKKGARYTAKFKGSTVVLNGFRHMDSGIAEVYIDGKKVGDADQFGYDNVYVGRMDQRQVPFRWWVEDLGVGEHTLEVVVSGKKNANAGGRKFNVNGITVYP